MHLTLHLTTSCNLNCRYCYSPPPNRGFDMTKEVIDKSIEFVSKEFKTNIGIIFFGGEPLLKKDLIHYTIAKCKDFEIKNNFSSHFHFKTTTNGTLLDEIFLKFSKDSGLNIGLSIDGVPEAHDQNRVFPNQTGSFPSIEKYIAPLLNHQPYASALMVVSPETLKSYAKSVEYLINKGFKYIISSINFAGNWNEKDLIELKYQYNQIALLYKKWIIAEKKFYFSPFEMKLATHIRKHEENKYTCQLSRKQISIAPDGKIYPCVQFVKDGISNTEFAIGDVWKGFDEKRETLFKQSIEEKAECTNCAFRDRCYNTCSCLNWQTTGFINQVSPLLCETERILIPIVDKLGEELFKKKYPMFIQKQYNLAYPLLSMLEDEIKQQ